MKNKYETPISIIEKMIRNGELGEYKPKKALGGILSAATQIIPAISSLYNKMNPPTQSTPAVENTNPYGYRMGGRGFDQYNSPQHEQGGQQINQNGTPVPNGTAEIEGTENKYKYSNIPRKEDYIFSDVNGTSDLVKRIMEKKFKASPDLDNPTKSLQEFEIQRAENINEALNKLQETAKNFRLGGNPTDPPTKAGQALIPQQLTQSESTNVNVPQMKLDTWENKPIPKREDYPNATPQQYDALFTGAHKYNNILIDSGLEGKTKLYDPYNDRREGESTEAFTQRIAQPSPTTSYAKGGKYELGGTTDPLSANVIKPLENTQSPLDNVKLPEIKPQGHFISPDRSSRENNDSIGFDEILRGTTLGLNASQLLRKPEQESLITPDYGAATDRFNKLNSNLDSARQEVLSGQNANTEAIRSGSSSYQQQLARQLQNTANTTRALSNVSLQEQQLRNQILGQQGQFEATKASDLANRTYQNRVDNMQNEAQNRNIKRSVLSDVVSEADRLSTIKNNAQIANATREETKAILSSLYPDFAIDSVFVDKAQQLAQGKITNEEYQKFVDNYSPIKLKK